MNLETMITSFSLGLLATTSPCVLPLYPGFLAYLSGGPQGKRSSRGRYFLGVFVLAGVLTMMLALGLLIALLSVSVGEALSVVIPIADTAIILLGVLLLLNINPFKSLPQVQVPVFSHPYGNAFLYGLLYGPIALPCSGPLVVGIFAISLTASEAIGKLGVFFWFGLGFGTPLLVLSLLSGALQRQLTRLFATHTRAINRVGGLLLLAVGIYDLAQNWALLLAYWS
ncbi:MAG: cytochrome c biogenesis CcdA family protein [Chloroflexota bacterium]